MSSLLKQSTRLKLTACFLLLACVCASCVAASALMPVGAQTYECAVPDAGAETRAEITVEAPGKTYVYRDKKMLAPDHTVYEQIERRNINAPLEEKIKTVDKCLAAGAEWREAMRYCFPLLPAFVEKIKTEIDLEPKDSEIAFRPQCRPMFRISRSECGRSVDEKRLYQDIYLALRKDGKARVTLKPQTLEPAVTVEDNIKLTKKISSFSTSFSTSAEGRKNNIRLALSKINGAVIKPGEEFSFNGRVGARTEKNGFFVAKIIVAGEYTDGVGGGVCQASTTLYNAALTAGMNVTCVRNHTILPSYVPPSLDAMVNSGASDLRFTNPYDTPVFIKAECVSDTARITFYGAELPHIIKTVSRVLSRTEVPQDKELIDSDGKFTTPDTPAGTRVRVSYGHAGVKSEAYLRYFSRSGKLLREEKIRTDAYSQTQGVVAVKP